MWRRMNLNNLLIGSFIGLAIAACGGSITDNTNISGNGAGDTTSAGISGTGVDDGSGQTTAGISGTGITQGTITGFGSIFVNGVKYEVDDDTFFDVDGNLINVATHQQDLKIGMVVRLDWTAFDDGSVSANRVIYDDSIEGPVTSVVTTISANRKSFTVMGVTVEVDDSSTSFHNSSSAASFGFDNIAQNDVIEVSGFVANNVVTATLVEKKGELAAASTTTQVEMHGVVTNLIVGTSFELNGVLVNFSAATQLDDLPNGLQDGASVEVKGFYNATNNTIEATEIEGEDDSGFTGVSSSDQSISLQGLITSFISSAEFAVNGIPVQVNTSLVAQSILDKLADGVLVEVEGSIENNVLIAVKVELRESQAEYRAIVSSRDTTARTLSIEYLNVIGAISMTIDSRSVILDENDSPISFADIAVSDDVKINARVLDSGEHLVVRLKRERNEGKSYEITGKIESYILDDSINIEGLRFNLDALVDYSGIGGSGNLANNFVVTLEDNDRNGFIDEVSLPD